MFVYVTLLIVLFNVEFNNGQQTKDHKRICYYTNWSQYRPGEGKFVPEDIDPFLCTHIVYAYAKVDGNRITKVEWNDEDSEWSNGMYTRLNNIKMKNPSLKTLLAVGGWSQKRLPISKMASLKNHRQEFANTSVVYLRSRGFDGLEIDWQYPEGFNDKKNFPLLLKEIRAAFDEDAKVSGQPALLLAIGVPGGEERIKRGYKVEEINRYVDFINLMSYDFHGSWETVTGHHSSLYKGPEEMWYAAQLNVDWAASEWIKEGATRNKLIIGIPMYGRGYSLEYKYQSGIGAMANGGSSAGEFLKTAGTLAYYEICGLLKTGAKVTWLPERHVPYLVHGNDWVGYDNQRSVSEKVQYVMSNTLGGVMIWSLDQDDFHGKFCKGGVKFPLLTAMNRTLNGEFVMTTMETIATTTTMGSASTPTIAPSTVLSDTTSMESITPSSDVQKPSFSTKVPSTSLFTENSKNIADISHVNTEVSGTTKIPVTPSPRQQQKNTRIITPPDTTFFPDIDAGSTSIQTQTTTAGSNQIILNDNEMKLQSNVVQSAKKGIENDLIALKNGNVTERENKQLTETQVNGSDSNVSASPMLDIITPTSNDSLSVVKLSKYISSIGKKQVTETSAFDIIDLNENFTTSSFSRRKLLQVDAQQSQNNGQRSNSRDQMNGFGSVLNSLFSVISEFSGGIGTRSTPPRRRNDADRQRQRQSRQQSRDNSIPGISSASPFDQQSESLLRDPQRRRESGANSVTPVPGRRNIRNRRPVPDRNNNPQSNSVTPVPGRRNIRNRRPLPDRNNNPQSNSVTPVPGRRNIRNRRPMPDRNNNPQSSQRLRGNLRRRRPNRNRLNSNRNGNQGVTNPNDLVQSPAISRMNRRRNMRNRALQQQRRNGRRNNGGIGRNSVAQRSLVRNGLTRGQIRDSFFTRIRESEPSLLQEPLLTSMDIPSLERMLGMTGSTNELPSEPNAQQNNFSQRRGNNLQSVSQQRRRILNRLAPSLNRPFRRSTIIPRPNQFRQITNLNPRNGNTNSSLMIIPLNNLDQSLQQVVSAGPGEQIRNQTMITRRNFQRTVMANPPTSIVGSVSNRRFSRVRGTVPNSGLSSNVAFNQPQTQLVMPRGPVVSARLPIQERKESVSSVSRSGPEIINIKEFTPSPPLGPVIPTPRTVIQPRIQLQRQPPVASSPLGLNVAQKVIPLGPVIQELPPRLITVERPRQQNVMEAALPTLAPVALGILPTRVPVASRRVVPQANVLNFNVDPTRSSSTFLKNPRLPNSQIPQTLVIQINPLPAGSTSLATGTIVNGNRQGQAVDIVDKLKPPGLLNINVPVPKEEALQTPLDVIQQSETPADKLLPQRTNKLPTRQPSPQIISNESQLNSLPKSEVLWKWEV